MKPCYYTIFSAAALGFLVAGCGGKSIENTPEAVAKAFTEAMVDGDMAAAADLCDYVTRARKANEDWDDITPGQRGLIIGKVKEQKQGELEGLAPYFGSGSEVGVNVGRPGASESTAGVTVTGGPSGEVVVTLVQSDGQWGVYDFTVGQ